VLNGVSDAKEIAMRNPWVATIALALLMCWAHSGAAEEHRVESRVVAVGLFKNGLATIRREVKLPGPGTFLVEDAPDPVHGTWWVESEVAVETLAALREVEMPALLGETPDLQRALAGKKVTIYFRDGQIPPVAGIVQELPFPKGNEAWSRTYEQPADYYGWSSARVSAPAPATTSRFLLLKWENGISYVDLGMIAYLKSEGTAEKVKQRRPVLLLTVPPDAKAATVTLTYLTKGISWAPSYRLDISDPKTLVLTQGAAIKNEFGDLEETEVQLITGYPSIQFGHVSSLLSSRTGLAGFFGQLSQRFAAGHASMRNAVRQQEVAYNGAGDAGLDLSAQPAGEGVDLYYHSIGKRSMKEGEALALEVATARGPYERIVEWRVPDTRDEWGRPYDANNYEYQRQQNPERFEDSAWDAVRFKNPLGFPMTTAAATIMANGRFNGQGMTMFVNNGEQTTLKINKALSVRTRSVEVEEEKDREITNWGGRNFRKVSVKGTLSVNNHRNEEIKVLVRRQFTGELVNADGDPKKILREEGVYSVNTRRELIWEVTLKPGEEKTLTYQYTVLVWH
jgi:hypothetical protein